MSDMYKIILVLFLTSCIHMPEEAPIKPSKPRISFEAYPDNPKGVCVKEEGLRDLMLYIHALEDGCTR